MTQGVNPQINPLTISLRAYCSSKNIYISHLSKHEGLPAQTFLSREVTLFMILLNLQYIALMLMLNKLNLRKKSCSDL